MGVGTGCFFLQKYDTTPFWVLAVGGGSKLSVAGPTVAQPEVFFSSDYL